MARARWLRVVGALVLAVAVLYVGVGVTGLLMARSFAATYALVAEVHGTPVDEDAWRVQWLLVSTLTLLGGTGGVIAGVAMLRGRRSGLAILAGTLTATAIVLLVLFVAGSAGMGTTEAGEVVVVVIAAAAAWGGWIVAGRTPA